MYFLKRESYVFKCIWKRLSNLTFKRIRCFTLVASRLIRLIAFQTTFNYTHFHMAFSEKYFVLKLLTDTILHHAMTYFISLRIEIKLL